MSAPRVMLIFTKEQDLGVRYVLHVREYLFTVNPSEAWTPQDYMYINF